MGSTANTQASRPSRAGRRFRAALFALIPLALFSFWECWHFARFGDLFGYGYHVDLVVDHSDIGVPRLSTAYCLRLTNYTFFPLKFQAIQTPEWGITDGAVLYHDRLEKWDDKTRSWSKVFDSEQADAPPLKDPNVVKNLLPGQFIYPTGCYEVATVEGIRKGDTVRLVAFTSYSASKSAHNQLAIYSPPFKVEEHPLKKDPPLKDLQK